MKLFHDLLNEDSKMSMVRLMGLICVTCACGLGIYGIINNRDLVGLAALCAAFIGPAFAGKVAQKYMEKE